jgi:threonine synthase
VTSTLPQGALTDEAPAGCRPGAFGNATHLICRACGATSPLDRLYFERT